jgi:DNA-binding transcriptional regulator PaaX
MAQLTPTQARLLRSLAAGSMLKSHRYLDGTTIHKLYAHGGVSETVRRATVQCLKRHGLIESNKMLPVATFRLTDRGRTIAARLQEDSHPVHLKIAQTLRGQENLG